MKIAKIDKETLAFKAQGDSVFGAVYGLYAKEDIVHPDGTTGVLYKQDSLIAQGVMEMTEHWNFQNYTLEKCM